MDRQFKPETLDMMRAFKRLFDPEGRLNPGKMLPTGKGCLEIRHRQGAEF
jgi:glycolate oxidase